MGKIRKTILYDIIEHIEEMPLDEAANVLLGLKRKYESEGWSDIKIETEESCDATEYPLVGERYEGDEERAKRESAERYRSEIGLRQ